MSPSSRSNDFSQLFRSSKKGLNSEKFYDVIDMESDDLHYYDDKCNNLAVTEAKDQMKQICKKYLRFLDTSKTWRSQFTVFDVSLLLSYWLYEKLIKIYRHRNSIQIILGFSDIQSAWANFFNYSELRETHIKNCKPELKWVDHEDWENRKKLYDYYVDYDHLFLMAQSYHNKCEYYEKIKEMSSIYKDYEGKCSTKRDDCPEFFHKFKTEKREYNLEYLPCYKKLEQGIDEAQSKASSSHHPGVSEQEHGAISDGYISPGREQDTLDTVSTPKSSDIGTKVSHSVLGAAPVLLTATMLYRYTPLGPWIRRFGGGRTNSMNAMDALSPYTQETGDMFSDDSANYISYQPI